jgi:fructokinase
MFLVCGEAIFDFFMKEDSAKSLNFDARMGGSPYNVAVGLRRLGIDTALFTGMANDFLGGKLLRSLVNEGVATGYIIQKAGPTTLSIVELESAGVPRYAFYGQGAADRSLQLADLPALDETIPGLHFGSFSLVCEPTASTLLALGQRECARRLISFDPNVRLVAVSELDIWRRRVADWIALAHVIKVSWEDLTTLFPQADPLAVIESWMAEGVALVVLTKGAAGAVALTARCSVEVAAPHISVVDTVGAGDAFQAALLYGLLTRGVSEVAQLAALEPEILREILAFASVAGAVTCTRAGADLPGIADIRAFSPTPPKA